jgi:hypothetical protein
MFDFLTEAQCERLRAQGLASRIDEGFDPLPVVKLFTPDAGATWLLSELDPLDEDRAYGLCDAGLGCPELGWVRLTELARVRGFMGRAIVQDAHFVPVQRLSAYAREARLAGRIQA